MDYILENHGKGMSNLFHIKVLNLIVKNMLSVLIFAHFYCELEWEVGHLRLLPEEELLPEELGVDMLVVDPL